MKKTSIILFMATLLVVFWSVSCSAIVNDETCESFEFDDSLIEADVITEVEENQISLSVLENNAITFKHGVELRINLSETSFTTVVPTAELLSQSSYLIEPANSVLWNIMRKRGADSANGLSGEDLKEFAQNIEEDTWELFVFLDGVLIQNSTGHRLDDLDRYPRINQITDSAEKIEIFLYNITRNEVHACYVE